MDTTNKTKARLREAFKHWCSAAENYSEPEEFRISINACIQAIRNVTFVLQKNKRTIDNFESWYQAWRTAMMNDPIMTWCVQARNFIVKEGDLETFSVAHVSLLNSHNDSKVRVFSVDPTLNGFEIALLIKDKFLPNQLKKYGYLQVERKWIVNDLEGIELLSALRHAFSVLNLLSDDIERHEGPKDVYKPGTLSKNDFSQALESISESQIPECMLAFDEYRTTNYNLGTGELANLSTKRITLPESNLPDIQERYGDIQYLLEEVGNTMEERVSYFLSLAKHILRVDGYHLTTVAIFDSSDKPHMMSTMFRDNEDKYLFWRAVAKKIKKLRAKMIITVADSWRAKLDPAKPLKLGERIADLKHKEEVIMVVGMNRKGEVISINTPYSRVNSEISFSNDEKVDVQPDFLNPIAKVFRKL